MAIQRINHSPNLSEATFHVVKDIGKVMKIFEILHEYWEKQKAFVLSFSGHCIVSNLAL